MLTNYTPRCLVVAHDDGDRQIENSCENGLTDRVVERTADYTMQAYSRTVLIKTSQHAQ